MKLENLSCNNCGAPLSVPDSANFVTCNHCSARLAIRRTESTTFTEQLERIENQQEEVLEKLEKLERQNRVAQIDRAWEREREKFMIADKHGHRREPNETMAVFGGVVVCVFGVFWTIMAFSIGGSFGFFGVIFILFGAGVSAFNYYRAKDFRAARRRYLRRRRDVYRDNTSPGIQYVEDIPTPQQYLEQLSEEERAD